MSKSQSVSKESSVDTDNHGQPKRRELTSFHGFEFSNKKKYHLGVIRKLTADSFRVMVSNGKHCWASKDLKYEDIRPKSLGRQNIDDYRANVIAALSLQREDYVYEENDIGNNKTSKEIKILHNVGGLKVHLCDFKVNLNTNEGENEEYLFGKLQEKYSKFDNKIKKLNDKIDQLTKAKNAAMQLTDEAINVKENLENELMDKFVKILNEKKRQIRKLTVDHRRIFEKAANLQLQLDNIKKQESNNSNNSNNNSNDNNKKNDGSIENDMSPSLGTNLRKIVSKRQEKKAKKSNSPKNRKKGSEPCSKNSQNKKENKKNKKNNESNKQNKSKNSNKKGPSPKGKKSAKKKKSPSLKAQKSKSKENGNKNNKNNKSKGKGKQKPTGKNKNKNKNKSKNKEKEDEKQTESEQLKQVNIPASLSISMSLDLDFGNLESESDDEENDILQQMVGQKQNKNTGKDSKGSKPSDAPPKKRRKLNPN